MSSKPSTFVVVTDASSRGAWIEERPGDGFGPVVVAAGCRPDYAERIARALNTHPALLLALKELLESSQDRRIGYDDPARAKAELAVQLGEGM